MFVHYFTVISDIPMEVNAPSTSTAPSAEPAVQEGKTNVYIVLK